MKKDERTAKKEKEELRKAAERARKVLEAIEEREKVYELQALTKKVLTA